MPCRGCRRGARRLAALERSWTSFDAFAQEVANGRIYDGVHFRFSTEAGTAMGRRIGALAAERLLRTSR